MDTGLFVMKALLSFVMYMFLGTMLWTSAILLVVYIFILIGRKIKHGRFWTSLNAYLILYRAGLTISHHEFFEDYHMHRFFWNGKMIQEIPDISRVDKKWVTLKDGHVEPLFDSVK